MTFKRFNSLLISGLLSATAALPAPAWAQTDADTATATASQNMSGGNIGPTESANADYALPEARQPSRTRSFDRYRLPTVSERRRPEYDAIGIKAGGFTLLPALDLNSYYSSNVYKSATNERGDIAFNPKASIEARSDWSSNALSLKADVDQRWYAKLSSDDATSWHLTADGRLDVFGRSFLWAKGERSHLNVDRGASGEFIATAEPIEYDISRGQIGGAWNRGRFTFALDGEFARFDYQDARNPAGGFVDEQFRDYDRYNLRGTADWSLAPQSSVFLSVDREWRRYRVGSSAALRDSNGYTVLAGVHGEITPLVRGRLGIGVEHQNFLNAGLRNLTTLAFDGNIDWLVTDITTISLSGNRTVQNTSLPTSPARLITRFRLHLDHELLRNVLLWGEADRENSDYRNGVDRDTLWRGAAGANWLLNAHIRTKVQGEVRNRSSDTGSGYTEAKLTAGVHLQL